MTGPAAPSGTGAAVPFRRLMSRWATGVSVVTTRRGTDDFGLTVNAFLSVAVEPPTVLVSLTHDADSTPAIAASGTYAVNFLAYDQRELSERFARAIEPPEKFAGLTLGRGPTEAPLLPSTLGALEAKVVERIDLADHRLFVGEVVALHPGRDVPPLLFFGSHYAESDGGRSLLLPAPPPKG
jgi:flavin reductase (DIM6/NTAB) family NADH-FMN oxidoreductase RutF